MDYLVYNLVYRLFEPNRALDACLLGVTAASVLHFLFFAALGFNVYAYIAIALFFLSNYKHIKIN